MPLITVDGCRLNVEVEGPAARAGRGRSVRSGMSGAATFAPITERCRNGCGAR
jgi:hypothetical protein